MTRVFILAPLALALATAGFGQTAAPVTAAPALPTVTLPTAISVVGEFNQLASPSWAVGFSVIYPVASQYGVYSTTTADAIPVRAKDPATGKPFYAVSASGRQGLHEKLLSTGNFTFLLGGDVGPGFSSTATTGINVSFTGSFVATTIYKVNQCLSVVAPIRMLYVSGIGWNPVIQAGVSFNLKNLPKGN
jgi:hypothetical protein